MVMVPVGPTEAMWGNNLLRWIVRWMGYDRPTPKTLFFDLKNGYGPIPKWLAQEPELQNQDHVVSKGTRAVILYRAMLAAAPASSVIAVDRNAVVEEAARAAKSQANVYRSNLQGDISIALGDNYRFGVEACERIEAAIRALSTVPAAPEYDDVTKEAVNYLKNKAAPTMDKGTWKQIDPPVAPEGVVEK
jgi:hypothetical protein